MITALAGFPRRIVCSTKPQLEVTYTIIWARVELLEWSTLTMSAHEEYIPLPTIDEEPHDYKYDKIGEVDYPSCKMLACV